MGFHAFVRTPGGRSDWYVDPAYNRPGTTAHLSYRSADLPAAEVRRKEGEVEAIRETVAAAAADRSTAPGTQVQRHYYRLALTSDPSYAAYFGTANVLAEKVTLINRVNQIYNDDLATELRLVNDTEKLNLDTDAKATGADGPCGMRAVLRAVRRQRHAGRPQRRLLRRHQLLRRLDAGQEPHRARSADRRVELRRRPHRPRQQRRRHRLPRRRRRRLQGRRLHRPAGAEGRLLRHRLRRPRDRPPVRRQPHLQRRPRRLRRQHLRGLGRAGLRLVGDGLRRHLRPGRPAAAHRPLLLLPHHRRGRRLPRGRPTPTSRCRPSRSATSAPGDTLVLSFDGTTASVPFADYDAAAIEAAVEAVTGSRRLHRPVGLRRVQLLRGRLRAPARSPTRPASRSSSTTRPRSSGPTTRTST